MPEKKRYPFYMYHKDFDEPLRVDDKDEERQLEEKGWQARYIHKDYPKYVNGTIVPNKAAHEALLASQPKVVKDGIPDNTGEPALEDMTVAQILSRLAGIVPEKDLKGKKKAELIELLKAVQAEKG